MSPGKINERVLTDKVAWIERMVSEINKLPLGGYQSAGQNNPDLAGNPPGIDRQNAIKGCEMTGRTLKEHIQEKMGQPEFKKAWEELDSENP